MRIISDQRIPRDLAKNTRIQQIIRLERPGVFNYFDQLDRDALTFLSAGSSTDQTAAILGQSSRKIKSLRSFLPGLAQAQTFDQLTYMGLHYGIVEFVPRDPNELGQITPSQKRTLGLTALGLDRPALAHFLGISQQAVANNRHELFQQWEVNNMRSAIMRAYELGHWATRSQQLY